MFKGSVALFIGMVLCGLAAGYSYEAASNGDAVSFGVGASIAVGGIVLVVTGILVILLDAFGQALAEEDEVVK